MMIKYEDIERANKAIRTTDIKGKEYAEVNQRIKAFRMVYPTGYITTEILKNEDGLVQIKATVGYRTDANELQVLSTGTAQEKENSSFINKTSYIENCETSAVGRALGIAGFGIDTSVASYEEVETAILNQEQKEEKKITYAQMGVLQKYYKGDNWQKLLDANGLQSIDDMTASKASELISRLKEASK